MKVEEPFEKLHRESPHKHGELGSNQTAISTKSDADRRSPGEIYTIGHSNYPANQFLTLLSEFHIELLVDIRRFAGSKKWPQFSQKQLIDELKKVGIQYMHMEALGGRRKLSKDSKNINWRHPSFRAYADYMQTTPFLAAIHELEALAIKQITVIMCSEVLWWRCHRALVSDFLKSKDWIVYHIMGPNKMILHPYTSVAKIVNGHLSYQ
ncbi:Protein of unknown function, DUF488 [Arachidicoccus rhizosphaerae]|uniref:DUF488 domain-containing protein n=1 Tax=Arachidicoccus rhizosphaerae TaxID=551991 RepID=A0A1H3ZCL9_9BACT|nr:DUF488 domain-containing protein [Arachidicoccus rhizosphaerae]SEA21092.1 Protein of unknown function, DUF488 [Arachidicoccus rhizosphaerae]